MEAAGGDAESDAAGFVKKKSSASEDDTHGSCSLWEARATSFCALLKIASALKPGVRIFFSNSVMNRLFAPSESFTA
ncbi:MAG: hypothetical protein WAL40_09860, partial [Rhodoplanes sp.]